MGLERRYFEVRWCREAVLWFFSRSKNHLASKISALERILRTTFWVFPQVCAHRPEQLHWGSIEEREGVTASLMPLSHDARVVQDSSLLEVPGVVTHGQDVFAGEYGQICSYTVDSGSCF